MPEELLLSKGNIMTDLLISLLNLSSKLLIYIGSASLIGGWFLLLINSGHSGFRSFIRRSMLAGAIAGLFAVGINFYAQVGSFAESGWEGLFDPDYQMMLWDSPVGNSVILRLAGFALALIIIVFFRFARQPTSTSSPLWKTGNSILFFVSLVLLSSAFALTGHTAEQTLLIRLLLWVHVFIALLWMGSLLPLWYACGVMEAKPLKQIMHRFGLAAMGLVAVLAVCGGVIIWQLLASPAELVTTAYGRVLLLKIGLVVGILGLAALHKFRLVPQLTGRPEAMKLRRSILVESLIGLGILVVTVLLTTVVGPEFMNG